METISNENIKNALIAISDGYICESEREDLKKYINNPELINSERAELIQYIMEENYYTIDEIKEMK